MPFHDAGRLDDPLDRRIGQAHARDLRPRRRADRAAVLARDRARHVAEQRLHLLDRAARDHGERAAEVVAQAREDAGQARRHMHGVRRRRDVEQGAVEVEQQRRLGGRGQRAQGQPYRHPSSLTS